MPFQPGGPTPITAAQLNALLQQGPWTAYTPSWTSAGSAPSIGNGSIFGFYSKIGRLVTVKMGVAAGSTTSFGSGAYSMSLPPGVAAAVTGIAAGAFAHVGSMALINSSTFFGLTAMIVQGSPTVVNALVNGSGSFWGATNPTTLNTTSSWVITMTCESTT